MAFTRKSTVIHASPERIFAYIDEPMNLVEWIPGFIAVHDIVGTGAGQQMEWTHKMAGVRMHGQTVVVEHVPNERAVHQLIGMINGTFTYLVEQRDQTTRLTLELEYSIPVPLVGRWANELITARNARELELALVNVKETLEHHRSALAQ
jgi:hypothetical protein